MSIKNKILSKSNQFNHYKKLANDLSLKNKSLKKENKTLKKENELLKKENNKFTSDSDYEKGISVIIPTYKGENHINPLLQSLKNQTLDKDLFELIFIINGELDSTMDILKKFIEDNPDMNIILSYTATPGVSNARNIGIDIAQREYCNFLDDDDFISPNFLEKLLKYSKPNRVVMANFMDVDEETNEKFESPIVPNSEKRLGIIKDAPKEFRRLATITVAKSVPTYAIKTTKFDTNLIAGVDVPYFIAIYVKFDFEFYFIDKEEEAVYYRLCRIGSVSRPELSYEFHILNRLEVIKKINESYDYIISHKEYEKYALYKGFIETAITAQESFIREYLKEHFEDKEKVLKEIDNCNFSYFNHKQLENWFK